jgi:hypothetical protein
MLEGEVLKGKAMLRSMRLWKIFLACMVSAVALLGSQSLSAFAASGAAFTTVNEAVDGPGHCLHGNPDVNCNLYDGKQYVWLNGGPVTAALPNGEYFFAVLSPGGQQDPNDGSPDNLSSPFDTYQNRTFSVDGGTITYAGSHDHSDNKIRLAPFANTPNPGGVYILAICSLSDGYPVESSDCKYDAFKVKVPVVAPLPLSVVKDAAGSYNENFTWGINKTVDQTQANDSGNGATFTYTVEVTHDGGTVSGVQVAGTITVINPNVDSSGNTLPVSGVNVTDELSDGTQCDVTDGQNQTLTELRTTFDYSCDLSALPVASLDNTAEANWPTQNLTSAKPSFTLHQGSDDFTLQDILFTATETNDCALITDTIQGSLGTVCASDPSPQDFTYKHTFTGDPAGTCTNHDNTAAFTTNTYGITGSSSQTVKVCVGAGLSIANNVASSFARAYTWGISKAVDKTLVRQASGKVTFNYGVTVGQAGFTDSGWVASGTITVTNPNDWEAVAVNLSHAVDNGGSCTIAGGGSVTIPASSSQQFTYTCNYAAPPTSASGTSTSTVGWDAAAASTPKGSANTSSTFSFTSPSSESNKTITVRDLFNGHITTLGTLTATASQPFPSTTFRYAQTVSVPKTGCVKYPNTATVVETGQSASKSVQVCTSTVVKKVVKKPKPKPKPTKKKKLKKKQPRVPFTG